MPGKKHHQRLFFPPSFTPRDVVVVDKNVTRRSVDEVKSSVVVLRRRFGVVAAGEVEDDGRRWGVDDDRKNTVLEMSVVVVVVVVVVVDVDNAVTIVGDDGKLEVGGCEEDEEAVAVVEILGCEEAKDGSKPKNRTMYHVPQTGDSGS